MLESKLSFYGGWDGINALLLNHAVQVSMTPTLRPVASLRPSGRLAMQKYLLRAPGRCSRSSADAAAAHWCQPTTGAMRLQRPSFTDNPTRPCRAGKTFDRAPAALTSTTSSSTSSITTSNTNRSTTSTTSRSTSNTTNGNITTSSSSTSTTTSSITSNNATSRTVCCFVCVSVTAALYLCCLRSRSLGGPTSRPRSGPAG